MQIEQAKQLEIADVYSYIKTHSSESRGQEKMPM